MVDKKKDFLWLLADLQRNQKVIDKFTNPDTREELLNTYNLTPDEFKASMDYEDYTEELRQLAMGYAEKGLNQLLTDKSEPFLYQSPGSLKPEYTDLFNFLFDASYGERSSTFKSNFYGFPFPDYRWCPANDLSCNSNEVIEHTAGSLYKAYQSKDPHDLGDLKEALAKEMHQLESTMG